MEKQNKVAVVTRSVEGHRARICATTSHDEQAGGRALAVQGDVAQVADVERVFREAVERVGGVDVAVNCQASGRFSNRGWRPRIRLTE